MARYIVLDTRWRDPSEATRGARRGRVLASFSSHDCATGLARLWMAFGDAGVVVIDAVTGEQVFPALPAGAPRAMIH